MSVARRRIYLMRHAQVRYFEGLDPEQVVLTEEGLAKSTELFQHHFGASKTTRDEP